MKLFGFWMWDFFPLPSYRQHPNPCSLPSSLFLCVCVSLSVSLSPLARVCVARRCTALRLHLGDRSRSAEQLLFRLPASNLQQWLPREFCWGWETLCWTSRLWWATIFWTSTHCACSLSSFCFSRFWNHNDGDDDDD